MIQNLTWATDYHLLAGPLAAERARLRGVLLTPAAGAVLLSVSTIRGLNAQLLQRIDFRPEIDLARRRPVLRIWAPSPSVRDLGRISEHSCRPDREICGARPGRGPDQGNLAVSLGW